MNHPVSSAPLTLRRRSRDAITLPVTIMIVATVVTFLSVGALVTSQFGRYAGRQQGAAKVSEFTDAALEYVYSQWRSTVESNRKGGGTIAPAASTVKIDKDLFTKTYFPYTDQMSVYSLVDLKLEAVDQNGNTPSTGATGVAPLMKSRNVPGYPGWTGYSATYLATATVKSSGYGLVAATATTGEIYTARRYFQVVRVPLCQGLGFYENVMEIHPGAAMILTGPIHSNTSIYAQGYGAFLQFKDNVSYVNKFVEGGSNPDVKYGWDGSNTGANNPDAYAPYTPVLWADGLPSAYNSYNNLAASTSKAGQLNAVSPIDPFGGASTNNNGLHDIIEKPATTNYSDQIAYNNAALVVELNSSLLATDANRIVIKVADGSGGLKQVKNDPTKDPLGTQDYNNVMAAIGSGSVTSMYDQRETATSVLTNLDMAKLDKATTLNTDVTKVTTLQTAFNKNGTQGGTVYIHDLAAKTTLSKPAIRLINGRDLGENVSVASDNPVYILGDYNTGGTKSTDVLSNQSNDDGRAVPQANGYNRYASSVMADAVTILSNNWNDGNASLPLVNRKAIATTVNTAILAGDVASNRGSNGIASGGLHNFPRFLENWQNINFTYYGSLIEAYNSEQATGVWQTNQVYYWPMRKWNFDTNFNTVQPPGLPQGIQYSRGRWERAF